MPIAHSRSEDIEKREREQAIKTMVCMINTILSEAEPSIYLYGSVVLDDFQFGWSDIDILILTQQQITEAQAKELVGLRQAMLAKEPENAYYRSFEGAALTLNAFISKGNDRVVYWGTSGERITDCYSFDSFCMAELMKYGKRLCGKEIREQLKKPSYDDLYADIKRHYNTIRKYAQKTGRNFYSFGWMLDIARCLYTLRTGEIISKTRAAVWALENGLCFDTDVLQYVLSVRRNPLKYQEDMQTLSYAETLGDPIQRFADVLEKELQRKRPGAKEI